MATKYSMHVCDDCKNIKEFNEVARCSHCNSLVCEDCVIEHEFVDSEKFNEEYIHCKGADDYRSYALGADSGWLSYDITDGVHKLH